MANEAAGIVEAKRVGDAITTCQSTADTAMKMANEIAQVLRGAPVVIVQDGHPKNAEVPESSKSLADLHIEAAHGVERTLTRIIGALGIIEAEVTRFVPR